MSEGWEGEGSERGPGLYPIRTVSRLTGVPAVTLRAWERRHGILHPTRTDKGHRLYTEGDVDRVRQVVALLERGVAVGQAGSLLAPEERERAADTTPGMTLPPAPAPGARAVTGPDRGPLAGLCGGHVGGGRVGSTPSPWIPSITMPCRCTPLDWVSQYLTHPGVGAPGRRVARPGGQHRPGAFLLEFPAQQTGGPLPPPERPWPRDLAWSPPARPGSITNWGCSSSPWPPPVRAIAWSCSGADVPEAEIAAAVHLSAGRAVILSLSARAEPETLARQVATLVALTSVPVLVGGAAADLWPQLILEAGARVLGTDFNQALQRLGECLGSP
jgi:DNA-binding transcriptional MerR regulator